MTADDLKALRRKLGLSQEALAEALGVNRHSVKRWEMGIHPISERTERALNMLRKTLKAKKAAR